MKQLIILCGPPGSGKSTLAKEYETRMYRRVSQDDQGKSGHMDELLKALATEADIIVDRMNFSKQQRKPYLDLAKKFGYNTKIIVLHMSSDTCMERMLKREGHPTIKDATNAKSALHTFMSKYERVEDSEADVVERCWPKGPKPSAIVSDIDNTLSDANHRQHHLERTTERKPNWFKFFSEMDKDPVNNWCREIVNSSNRHAVLLTSARPDDYREVTEVWLKENKISYSELIMRPRGDHRKDDLVKEQLYEFEIKTRYEVLFWLDDRKQVIEKIRSHGVTVLDCAGPKGDF